MRRLWPGRARDRAEHRRRPVRDLPQRPDEGRGASRARDSARAFGSRWTASPSSSRAAATAARRKETRPRSAFGFGPDLVGRDAPSEMSPDGASCAGPPRYKAGIPTEDILALGAAEIADASLELTGIHLHVGRHSADPAIWERGDRRALRPPRASLRSRWDGWLPRELDVGGGFPRPGTRSVGLAPKRAEAPDHAPPVDEYADAVCGRSPAARGSRGRTARAFGSRSSRGAGSTRTPGPPGDGRQRQAPAPADAS